MLPTRMLHFVDDVQKTFIYFDSARMNHKRILISDVITQCDGGDESGVLSFADNYDFCMNPPL